MKLLKIIFVLFIILILPINVLAVDIGFGINVTEDLGTIAVSTPTASTPDELCSTGAEPDCPVSRTPSSGTETCTGVGGGGNCEIWQTPVVPSGEEEDYEISVAATEDLFKTAVYENPGVNNTGSEIIDLTWEDQTTYSYLITMTEDVTNNRGFEICRVETTSEADVDCIQLVDNTVPGYHWDAKKIEVNPATGDLAFFGVRDTPSGDEIFSGEADLALLTVTSFRSVSVGVDAVIRVRASEYDSGANEWFAIGDLDLPGYTSGQEALVVGEDGNHVTPTRFKTYASADGSPSVFNDIRAVRSGAIVVGIVAVGGHKDTTGTPYASHIWMDKNTFIEKCINIFGVAPTLTTEAYTIINDGTVVWFGGRTKNGTEPWRAWTSVKFLDEPGNCPTVGGSTYIYDDGEGDSATVAFERDAGDPFAGINFASNTEIRRINSAGTTTASVALSGWQLPYFGNTPEGTEADAIDHLSGYGVVITDIKKPSNIFCFIVLLYMLFKVKAK